MWCVYFDQHRVAWGQWYDKWSNSDRLLGQVSIKANLAVDFDMMWVPACARVYRAVRTIFCTAAMQLKIDKELKKPHLHDAVFLYVAG